MRVWFGLEVVLFRAPVGGCAVLDLLVSCGFGHYCAPDWCYCVWCSVVWFWLGGLICFGFAMLRGIDGYCWVSCSVVIGFGL